MNILFLALDVDLGTDGGEATHVRELAGELGARGNRVDLVTATSPESAPVLGEGVFHYKRLGASDIQIVLQCCRIVGANASHAIYERRLSPKVSYAVSTLMRRPFAVEVNGVEEEAALLGQARTPFFRGLRARLRSHMFRQAARIVTVSDGLSADVQRRHGVDPRRIVTVPNGANTSLFVPMDPEKAMAQLGLPRASWIVFVGDIVIWQGLETLLRSVRRVVRLHPEARFLIVGDGAARVSSESLARELAVIQHVSFAGRVPYGTVPAYIGAACVCVAPFARIRNEAIGGGSSLKVHEYLACGRPVVASDLPGIRDDVRASGGGLLVPPDDADALAESLLELLSDADRRQAMGEAGREYIVREGSWVRTAERVERVLADALARS